jgi:PPOX class probable F420-dependent enzyme
MVLADEKYIALTTFRRDGSPVTTAVWVAPLDEGRFGFWTSSTSGKAKRLRNDPKVTVQPCNGRGKVKEGTAPQEGTARTVTEGADFDQIQAKVKAKYGVQVTISRWLNSVGALVKRRKQPYGDTGVVITLN